VDHYVTIEGQDRMESALASGRPVIFVTGHYGNWEFSPIVTALRGAPIVALARAQEKLPKLYRLLVSYRESKGCTIVHKGGAMKRLIAALEARRPIGIVGDQASRQGEFVDFFGRPALFARGPFELTYSKDALLLPAFIHRIRGPYHRLVFEPAIELPRERDKARAVRDGMEQFVAALARHITDDPGQWLWMHKRWKHTPARRVLILSDGKRGHLKQSLVVLEALREHQPTITHQVVEIRYRNRWARGLAVLWSWWVPSGFGAGRCLSLALQPESSRALLTRFADLVISCGSSTVPANLLWAAENRAKSITIMNPAPLPLARFHLVIAPRHDRLPRRHNVVQTAGAVSRMREKDLVQAGDRLRAHPKFRPAAAPARHHPVVAVFIGGDTDHYELSPAFADAFIRQIRIACETADGWYLVTTSRRTSPVVERLLGERIGRDPRCRLLLVANRDPLDGTMEGMLGSADVAVVTGESVSMVSEACTSGRRVIVVEPPLRRANRASLTKHQQFLHELVAEGYVRLVPVPELALTVQRGLKEPQPAKRVDNFGAVRDAVAPLLS